jgi:3-deoxy-D-manno-octulosonic-acid transferase
VTLLLRCAYAALLWLLLPLACAQVLWRGLRDRDYWRGWRERFGAVPAPPPGAAPIWVHGASVGEAQVAATFASALRRLRPGAAVQFSANTPAGRARAQLACASGESACFAPYDLGWCVRRRLARMRPAALVVIEAEIWPNLLHECHRAGVPVLFVSARMSERTQGRLARFAALFAPALRAGVHVQARTAADAARFVALGVPPDRVAVGGNLKFDRQPATECAAAGRALRATYAGSRAMWVAGSTHPGEELAALAAHRALCAAQGSALLVLAPRHRPRFAEVAALLAGSGFAWARRSEAGMPTTAAPDVLLLDTFGELEACYAAADLAFVGGSLASVGGHNLLEPAALGAPVLAGPHLASTREVADALSAAAGLRVVADAGALATAVCALMADPAARARLVAGARAVLDANGGAAQRAAAALSSLLPPAR